MDDIKQMNDELYLLTAVLANPWLYPKLRLSLSIEEMEDPEAKELFIALEEWFRSRNTGVIPADLLSRINNKCLRDFVEKGVKRTFSLNPESLVQDFIKRIKVKHLERRRGEIITELRKQKTGHEGFDTLSHEDLLAGKMHIDAELIRLRGVVQEQQAQYARILQAMSREYDKALEQEHAADTGTRQAFCAGMSEAYKNALYILSVYQ
jgi:hypothetical protein